jgi:hypothetical protein
MVSRCQLTEASLRIDRTTAVFIAALGGRRYIQGPPSFANNLLTLVRRKAASALA